MTETFALVVLLHGRGTNPREIRAWLRTCRPGRSMCLQRHRTCAAVSGTGGLGQFAIKYLSPLSGDRDLRRRQGRAL